MRADRNYEVELKNIKYSDAKKIKEEKNIKEISMMYELGTSEENIYDNNNTGINVVAKLDIKAFDENAMKNNSINLIEGRLPINDSEIVVSSQYGIINEIGQELELTINGKIKRYKIVGRVNKLYYDKTEGFTFQFNIGAFTYLENEMVEENTVVDITFITNNIHKIYETTDNLIEKLKLYENKEKIEKNVTYNDELLYYSLVDVQSEKVKQKAKSSLDVVSQEQQRNFGNNIIKTTIAIITIISIASVITIYTSFKINYKYRIKELGILSFIGMSSKQKTNFLLKEGLILATIGIIIGISIGVLVSMFLTKYLNVLASQSSIRDIGIMVNPNIKLYMIVPIRTILLTIILVYIITIISSILPINKLNKVTIIEAIKDAKYNNAKIKQIKVPKLVKIIFKQEGELAYKNIKKDKAYYKAIVLSIMCSIIIFLSASNFIRVYHYSHIKASKNNYQSTLMTQNAENFEEVNNILINYLTERNLVNDYVGRITLSDISNRTLEIEENKISKEVLTLAQNKIINLKNVDDKILGNVEILVLYGSEYDKILENLGIKEIGLGECILIDTILENTKYGNNIKTTNYEVGDILTINKTSLSEYQEEDYSKEEVLKENSTISEVKENTEEVEESQEQKGKSYLKIVGITSGNTEIGTNLLLSDNEICKIIISKETAIDWGEKFYASIMLFESNEPNKMDDSIELINNILKEKKASISGMNIYLNKIKENNQRLITRIVIYSFVTLFMLFSVINIFNIITSSIIQRKREVAKLRSIGLSKKQLNKMLISECTFYGFDAVLYGLLISIGIIYIMYRYTTDASKYSFTIPWFDFIICIIVTYLIIFMAKRKAKKNIENKNIIDEIKDENI